MANRVTEDDVLAIMDTSLTASQVTPFLAGANQMVTTHLGTSGYATAVLGEIERWLTAHLASIRDRKATRTTRKIGDAEERHAVTKLGSGLDGSPYGQQVKLLDTKGILTNLSNAKRIASFKVL